MSDDNYDTILSDSALTDELQLLMDAVQENPDQLDFLLNRLKELQEQYPHPYKLSIVRLRMLMVAGRHNNALAFASKIIPLLLEAGMDSQAVIAYRVLGKSKLKLEIESSAYQQLGRALREQGDFRGAAWNYCKASSDKQNEEGASKICLQLAAEAEQAKKPEEAIAIYRFFITQFPTSPMLDFIKSSIEFQEMQIERIQEEQE